MKKVIPLICLVFIGCKGEEPKISAEPSQAPVPSGGTLLKTEGCTVFQTKGVLKVDCADGSSAEAGVPQYHIKDASGTDLNDLMFLQNWSQVGVLAVNKKSGNLLSYDSTGNITRVSRTLFESTDCSGRILAFFSDFIVRNKVMANNGAGPNNIEAFRVTGYIPTVTTFNSEFKNGACNSWSGSSSGATILEATDFDDSDPIAIGLPIEIVISK